MSATRDEVDAALAADDQTEAARLAAILDHEDQARDERVNGPAGTLPAALWYASIGVPVFPLQARSKLPYPMSHGCKDATTDPAGIRAWWDAHPDANIGLATGHTVDVIDVDGLDGIRALRWRTSDPVGLPPILGHAITPRGGGWHLYVPATGRGNKANIYPSVDYRGRGGYVVAPPSVGDNGQRYRWLRPLNLDHPGEDKRPGGPPTVGPCARCGTHHERYGGSGNPLCETCRGEAAA